MERVLIIAERYYPEDTANSALAHAVGRELYKQGYAVDFYVLPKTTRPDCDNDCGGKTYFIDNVYTESYRRIKAFGRDYLSLPKLLKLPIKIIQCLKAACYRHTGNSYTDTVRLRRTVQLVSATHRLSPYKYMLSTVHPFGLTKVASAIKRAFPDIRWSVYMLDPFIYNCTAKESEFGKRTAQFLHYTAQADSFILTRGIKETADKRGFSCHKPSVIVDLPNLSEGGLPLAKETSECVFAGMFYKDIRNPKKMLEVFASAKSLRLTLIGDGCEDIVKDFQPILGERLTVLGRKNNDECRTILSSARALVNLGNTAVNQMPSKVFDYIASGKPVLNFYQTPDDPSLYYFDRYPLAYSLNLNCYESLDVEQLERFVAENAGKRLTFDEATAKLSDALSDNVLRMITSALKGEL